MTPTPKAQRIGTATAVMQFQVTDDTSIPDLLATVQQRLDVHATVRRLSVPTTHPHNGMVEFRCGVEYGPVRATWGEMQRHIERHLRTVTATVADGGGEVMVSGLEGDDITTPEQLEDIINKLTAKSKDVTLPIAQRKQLETTIRRLRHGKDAGRVPRMS